MPSNPSLPIDFSSEVGDPESRASSSDRDSLSKHQRWKRQTRKILESWKLHTALIILIGIDAVFVLTDLSYTFLHHCKCTAPGHPYEAEEPVWIEVLSHLSLGITSLFLLEIPIAIWAFGWRYYDPIHGHRHGFRHTPFHFFDAVVIIGTFIIELVLKGKQKELASLVIVLRLWRLIKLVGGVAVGVDEYNEQHETPQKLRAAQHEVQRLRKRIHVLEQELAQGEAVQADQ